MIGASIHLPDAELYRFARSHDRDAPDNDWARHHLETGCSNCATKLLRFQTALAGPSGGFPNWIRPERIAVAGARAGMLADTKLVCGAGPYEVDVLVRELDSPRSLEFLGQITRAGRLHEPVVGLPLSLVRAVPSAIVGDTSTDDFGEFDLTADPAQVVNSSGSYGLRVGAEANAPCVLVWEGAA